MSWTYRALRRVEQDEPYLCIVEVYTADDGTVTWTENASWPSGATVDELRSDLFMMGVALLKPVMEEVNGTIRDVEPK